MREATPRADVLVVAGWGAIFLLFALTREDYAGDGIRHVAQVLDSSRPALGEARWLLFPVLLFASLKPLQLCGLVANYRDAVHAFAILDAIAATLYLWLLRRWLLARNVAPLARAAILFGAGAMPALLRLGSDTTEVIVPAVLALGGLVYSATRVESRAASGAIVAAGAVALASLFYQGLLFAAFLIPLAAGLEVFSSRRTLATVLAILVAAPVIASAILVSGGEPLEFAIREVRRGEQNPLYVAELESATRPLWSRVAALSVGPAENLIPVPANRGIGGLVRGVVHGQFALLLEGIGFLLGLIFYAALVLHALKRRESAWLLALAGILILPLARSFQYSYVKFFVLFPGLVAIGAANFRTRAIACAAALIAAFNLAYQIESVRESRALAASLAPAFSVADTNSCWLTSSWGPPILGWPGRICSMAGVLAASRPGATADLINRNSAAFVTQLRACFCAGSTVITDDFSEQHRTQINAVASHYRFSRVDLDSLLWRPELGTVLASHGELTVLGFSPTARERICAELGGVSK